MNKARMTFRFNEESSRQHGVVQDDQKTAPNVSNEIIRQDLPRLEHENSNHGPRNEHIQDVGNKTRDHLHVIPGPMQGWSDPFNKDDPWDEILLGQQSYREDEELQRNGGNDDVRYDGEIGGQEDEWLNFGDRVYPQLGDVTYRPRRPTSLWKIIGTVTGAVVTGALFGFVVLSFFKDGSGASVIPVKQNAESVKGPASGQVEAVKAAPVTVHIKGHSYYMLQYGVFSSKERVMQAQKELQQYGIAAGSDSDLENRVYAGISPDRERAKLLSNQLKARGVDLYVREVTLPAASELKFGGGADTANQYFAVSSELVSKLSQLSAVLLCEETPSALNADQTAEVTDLHSRWMEAMKSFQTGLGAEDEQFGAQLEQTMNSAVSAVTEYNRNVSKGLLWEVQSSMMKYVMHQKELIAKLEKA
ncbi:SPOR domain-containing protein [Paenibacillus sp.]|uniref:SPOR domain-containing protein n=1 Tax=Paenibacillus sp. TaxID=58172 RepID=UPI002835C7F2|nr:SPOR domain-containing protein [Paenibacillus sp.]MDR0267750.1 SPOR domain-containing protein [Paenibacillus sp.]